MIVDSTVPKPIVSIVLGSYNRRKYLNSAIESLRNNGINMPYEVIVIDGGSTDGSIDWLTEQKDITTIVHHNRGEWRGRPIPRRSWGYFMNLGFKTAQGKYICMISDDCLLIPDAIKNGVEHFEKLSAENRNVGSLAFYYRDWPYFERYFVWMVFGVIYVNHGLYLRSALEEIGWIDEENFRFYNADQDLCLRLKGAGYECLDSPNSFVEHHAHANPAVGQTNQPGRYDDQRRLIERWRSLVPAGFNPEKDDFSERKWSDFKDPTDTAREFRRLERLSPRYWDFVFKKQFRKARTGLKGALGLGRRG